MVRRIICRLMPARIQKIIRKTLLCIRTLRYCLYDMRRYVWYSITEPLQDAAQIEAKIIACTHVVEKGFSMLDTKELFGVENAMKLLALMKTYKDRGLPQDKNFYQSGIIALEKYFEFHKSKGLDLSDIGDFLTQSRPIEIPERNCYLEKTREELTEAGKQDFKKFAASRYSIRNFDTEPVDTEILKKAIQLSQKSPSCCNRQSSRVYIVQNREKVEEVLSLHNGNRGFGHLIDKLLIVAADLRAFEGPKERYQGFIDGGMFAMSLLYALHYYGLGACALNWCADRKTDYRLRKTVNIEDCDTVLMMIGVGCLPENLKVACSQRKALEEIISCR